MRSLLCSQRRAMPVSPHQCQAVLCEKGHLVQSQKQDCCVWGFWSNSCASLSSSGRLLLISGPNLPVSAIRKCTYLSFSQNTQMKNEISFLTLSVAEEEEVEGSASFNVWPSTGQSTASGAEAMGSVLFPTYSGWIQHPVSGTRKELRNHQTKKNKPSERKNESEGATSCPQVIWGRPSVCWWFLRYWTWHIHSVTDITMPRNDSEEPLLVGRLPNY